MSKLIYFPVSGRGGAIRVLLGHAKAEYENEEVNFQEFGARKAAGEFINGQLPVWIQNGKQYNESLAILRFIGAQHGYYPQDHEHAWQVDANIDFMADFIGKFYPPHMKNEHTEESIKTYEENLTKIVTFLGKQLEKTGSRMLVGDKFTIADAYVSNLLFTYVYNDSLGGGAQYSDKGKAIIEANAAFHKYVKTLQEEELKDWLATRKHYAF